jgi:monooxygenase
VLRSIDQFPRSGSRAPWRLGMSYARDVITLRYGKIDDGAMRFSRLPRAQSASRAADPAGKYRQAG